MEDGATALLYYESRLARIELDENERPHLDEAVDAECEDEDKIQQEALKREWSGIEALVGREKRLKLIAENIVKHFEARTAPVEGKGMIVCMSRRICVALYDGTKGRRDLLAKRTRDANDPLKLVIVRDMWLTGFDAPSFDKSEGQWFRGLGASRIRTGASARTGQENSAEVCLSPGFTG